MTDAAPPRTKQRRVLPLYSVVKVRIAGVTLAWLVASGAAGQILDRPIIIIAATMTAEATTQVPFPILGPPASIPRDSFVKVRGMPPMAALLEGHAIAPGSWAIALSDLSNLKVVLPADVTGSADIVVSLVGLDGSVLAEARTALVLRVVGAETPRANSYHRDLTPQGR